MSGKCGWDRKILTVNLPIESSVEELVEVDFVGLPVWLPAIKEQKVSTNAKDCTKNTANETVRSLRV